MIIVQNIDLRSWEYFYTDQIRPFIDIHLGKQFILALVEAIFKISVDCVEKNRKKMTRFRLWTLKSSYPIMVINEKNWVTENTHFLLAYGGINRMKALNKLLQLKNDRLGLWE